MARTRATARHPQGWFYLVEQLAAKHVNLVYQRYNTQVAGWRAGRAGPEAPR